VRDVARARDVPAVQWGGKRIATASADLLLWDDWVIDAANSIARP
jgi:hypothetical protein